MGGFLSWLSGLDHSLLLLINRTWAHPALDATLPWLSTLNREAWARYGLLPVSLGLWLWKGREKALKVLIIGALAVGVSDFLAYRVIKPWVARPRPSGGVIVRATAGGTYGFPSNHASNAAAGAAVLSVAYPGLRVLYWLVALLVAYSRVYCGVHYPGDVAAGLLLGWLIGAPFAKLMLGGGSGSSRSKRRS